MPDGSGQADARGATAIPRRGFPAFSRCFALAHVGSRAQNKHSPPLPATRSQYCTLHGPEREELADGLPSPVQVIEVYVHRDHVVYMYAVGGGVRIHPGNARMSALHGEQLVAQCVACAALTLLVWK